MEWDGYRDGAVLSDGLIEELLIDKGKIINADKTFLSGSSLDLRLSDSVLRMQASVKPLEGQTVEYLIRNTGMVDVSVNKGHNGSVYFSTENPYLVRLVESFSLPRGITARTFNRSSLGRIGVSVRTICDGEPRFDVIPAGYEGPLYAEVHPTTIPLTVYPGKTTMPQVRFYFGHPRPLEGDELEEVLGKDPILYTAQREPIVSLSRNSLQNIVDRGTLEFTADLSGPTLLFRAKRSKKALDVSCIDYNWNDFFEKEVVSNGKKGVRLDVGDFALVQSNEFISLPMDYAAEIDDYSAQMGEFRSHYAGLVNPGHGVNNHLEGNIGSRILFEIRAHDTSLYLQHGQSIAGFKLFPMACPPNREYSDSYYPELEDMLPRFFKKK